MLLDIVIVPTAQSMNVDKAIFDLSGRPSEIIDKIVESSAYLVNDVSSQSSNSKSFVNILKSYGSLTLPCVVPLFTSFHSLKTPLYITRCLLYVLSVLIQNLCILHRNQLNFRLHHCTTGLLRIN